MSYQKCPICNGTGQDLTVSISNGIPTCPICKGHRIINEQTGLPPSKTDTGPVINEETIRKINEETKTLLQNCRNKVPECQETKDLVKQLATPEAFVQMSNMTIKQILDNSKLHAIRRVIADLNYSWPKQLTSGIMFYDGHRITIEEFQKEVKLFKGELREIDKTNY